jgi:hypothetical protein
VTKFHATITLFVEDFDARDYEHAQKVVNSYIDSLADTQDKSLAWGECDFVVDYTVAE